MSQFCPNQLVIVRMSLNNIYIYIYILYIYIYIRASLKVMSWASLGSLGFGELDQRDKANVNRNNHPCHPAGKQEPEYIYIYIYMYVCLWVGPLRIFPIQTVMAIMAAMAQEGL